MIREEMRSEAKVRLIGYRKNHEMVANWESYSDPQSKRGDNMGIRSGKTSDPTANAATNRADPPQYIVVAQEWNGAINDAWADLSREDEDNGCAGKGKAFVLENYYGLTKPPLTKYSDRVDAICKECAISQSTMNAWLRDSIEAVVLHALARQLV